MEDGRVRGGKGEARVRVRERERVKGCGCWVKGGRLVMAR